MDSTLYKNWNVRIYFREQHKKWEAAIAFHDFRYCRFAFILVNKDHLLTMGTSLFQCRLYAFQLCYFMTKAQSVAVYWQNHWLRACWQRRVPGHTVYIAEDIVKLLAKLDYDEGRMDDIDLKRVSSAGLFGEFLKYQFNQWNSGTVCI